MTILYRFVAEAIFVLHGVIMTIILFGWAVPRIWPLYMAVLALTFVSQIALGHCFLSKWEFALRKKLNPKLDYNYSFTSYYTYKLMQRRLSERFLANVSLAFLFGSLIINSYFWLIS